jgi:replicative DNA helicase
LDDDDWTDVSSSPERLLLSSIVRDGDMNVAIQHGLAPDMFHAFPDEWLWMQTYYMKYKRSPSKLAFKHKFPEFRIAAVNDTSHFADEVRRHHARTLLTGTLRDASNLIADGKLDAALMALQGSVVGIAAGMSDNVDQDIFSNYEDTLVEVDRRWKLVETKGYSGIPTGIPTLDERVGGFNAGELWLFAARLGEGKSWTLQSMALAAAMEEYVIQFNALEQSRAQVSMRIHALLSGSIGKTVFSNTDLMQGKGYDPGEYRLFLKDMKETIKGKLHVSDSPRLTPLGIAAQIEKNKPHAVYVDYVQLMSKGKDWQDIAAISGELKAVAMEYQVPVIGAAQLNRDAAGGKGNAGPEKLGGSDALGQDADGVVTSKQLSERVIRHMLAKNRNGPGGQTFYIHFDPTQGIYKEVSANRARDLMDEDEDRRDREETK